MNIIIEIILSILLLLFGVIIIYQVILTLFSLRVKAKETVDTGIKRKFAIVVPAHNEEQIIAKTVYSLFALIYPRKLYDVVVVADNCTDNTASVARGLGALVYERSNQEKQGKGYALRWIFDRLLNSEVDYDAFIVIDSDSLVSGNYLEVMNDYLDRGSRVIQSRDLVLPKPGNWSIEATRIGFMLFNYVKPLGRKSLNLNIGLRGNGMCFSTEVLKKFPWQAWSLTEDVEYGLQLMQKGIKIDFAPEATVWAQMPVQSSNAVSQRSRWEIGRRQITRQYAGYFLKSAIRNRSFMHLDIFIELMTPPFVNTMLYVGLLSILSFLLWLTGIISILFTWLWAGLAIAGLIYLFLGLYSAGADRSMYRSVFYIPIYIFWKLKVYLSRVHPEREVKWIRTTRDH